MYKELIVNVSETETRVALVEDGNISELFIERGDEENITGNIYKGTVQRVLPGMQAAFVDIGLKQATFLYVDDVIKKQNLDESEPPEKINGLTDKDDFVPNNTQRNIPI
jgi:ribonuclease G